MHHDHQSHETRHANPTFNWILVGFLLVAGYFLVLEHRAHLEGVLYVLPYLLLLACPLMHLFMHHGHGGHGERPPRDDNQGEQK
jgi:hypothetical protein